MPYPVPFLIFLQFLLHDLAAGDAQLRFFLPVDGLRTDALECYKPRDRGALRMLFYLKSGELWQGPADPDGVRWSGYRTLSGEAYRYAQARAYVSQLAEEDAPTAEMSWTDAGLIDNIPTCVPASCLPDYRPVMELVCWVGGETRLELRYAPPAGNYSPANVVDSDPLAPGKEGDFGAVTIDTGGFKRLQRGVDLSGQAGTTPVTAAAVGRVVLVSRDGERKASALEPGGAAVTADFPPGRPDKGATLKEYGNCVYVAHPDGYSLRYAHLDTIEVTVGQGVLAGTRIGTAGGQGADSKPGTAGWVHIEVRLGDPLSDGDSLPVNPWEFFNRKKAPPAARGAAGA
jgi:murein DD-endopeptidase MepM/ murein hydrolase activator NlpD